MASEGMYYMNFIGERTGEIFSGYLLNMNKNLQSFTSQRKRMINNAKNYEPAVNMLEE